MKYNTIYELNERGRATICPQCKNEDIADDANYCEICGASLINRCTNTECNTIGSGKARFCKECGSETEFGKRGYLKTWNTEGEIEIIDEIVEDEIEINMDELEDNEEIYFLNRLRLADNEPIAIEYCYLPEKFFPDLIKYNMVYCSLYKVMKEEYNMHFNYMKQSLKAISLNKKEAEMLLGKPKGVGLLSERLIYNIDGYPIEFTKTIYHSERYTFNMVLFNNNN